MIRALLVVIVLIVFALALLGMRIGWRNRAARQSSLPALVQVPTNLGTVRQGAASGLYIGSAFATSWQDRVVVGELGLRAAGEIALYESGAVIERQGQSAVFIPTDALIDARLAEGLAGKVVGAGGLLVLRWRLGDAEIDSAFRADDKSIYVDWVRAVDALVGVSS